MPAFKLDVRTDGIAIITVNLAEEKVNKLTTAVMEELDRLLDEAAAKKEIKALVFASGKDGNFIVGADIAEIRDITDPKKGEEIASKGQAILAKLEALPFPTVAAIHGPCMGGGLELALACWHRVISNDQRTMLAQSEVKLGIIPGFGGTQRLPRLVGLTNALDMILTGKSVYAKKARRIGLADEVVYKEILLETAVKAARKAVGGKRPRTIRARRPLIIRLMEGNPLTRSIVYRMAKRTILKETRGNYPAPLAALDAVRTGLGGGRKAGYRKEARYLGELAATAVSKNLVSIYYLNEALKKDATPSPARIIQAGVLGAGVMGGGIAQLFAEKGIFVRMKDIKTTFIGTGLKSAAKVFKKRAKKGILDPLQARNGFDRITGTLDYSGLEQADVTVEAVVENMDVKKAVLTEYESIAKENAIFASNTSSLSITGLATASKHPDKVVGMHFFNPVDKMPLIEIIRGEKTSDETVAAIATLSRKLGKLPVTVNDCPGFLVNRILMPYLGEAVKMLEEGKRIGEIDQELFDFGMPMGAFMLLDEIGIDVAHKVADILYEGLGERVKPSSILATLHKEGFLGKKNGKGFYRYKGRVRKGPDESVYARIAKVSGRSRGKDDIIDRTVLLMVKEAALCLEETIIERADYLDGALIFGIGFPPFRGGLLRYADDRGIKDIVEKLEGFAKQYGERFAPPKSLIEMAGSGKGFYA